MFLWFVFVCSVKLQKCLKCLFFFPQFLGLWGVAYSCLFGFGRFRCFVFLVLFSFVLVLFLFFVLFLYCCWIVFGVVFFFFFGGGGSSVF